MAMILLVNAYLVLSYMTDPEQMQAAAESFIRRAFHSEVEIGNLTRGLGCVMLENIVLRSPADGKQEIARIKKLSVRFSIPKLLLGRAASIQSVKVECPTITVPELRSAPPESAAPQEDRPPPRSLPRSVTVRDGTIRFRGGPKGVDWGAVMLRGVSLDAERTGRTCRMKGEFTGPTGNRCQLSGEVSPNDGRGDLRLLAENMFLGESFGDLLTGPVKKLWERIGLSGTANLEVGLHYRPDQTPRISCDGRLSLLDCQVKYALCPVPVTRVRGDVKYDGQTLVAGGVTGRVADGTVTLQRARLTNSEVTLRINAQGLKLDDDLRANLPEDVKEICDEFGLDGGRLDTRYDYRVVLGPERTKTESALVTFQGCDVKYREFPVKLTNLSGKVRWRKGFAELLGLQAQRGASVVKAAGQIAVRGPGSIDRNFQVSVDGLSLDEEVRQALPSGTQEIWAAVQPKGQVDVQVAPLPTDDDGKVRCKVTMKPKGCEITYTQFPLRLFDINAGTLVADGKSLSVSGLAGRCCGGTVQVDGVFRPGDSRTSTSLVVKATDATLNEALYGALPKSTQRIWDTFRPRGHLDAVWRVESGSDGELVQSGDLAFADCSVTHKHFPLPLTRVTGRAKVSADSCLLEGFSARHADARIEMKDLHLPLGDDGEAIVAEFVARDLALDKELFNALPEGLQSVWKSTELKGGIDLDRLRLELPEDGGCLFGGAATLKRCSFVVGVPLENVSGTVTFAQRPTDEAGRHAWSAHGRLGIGRTVVKGKELKTITADLGFEQSVLVCRNIVAELYGGTFSGSLDADLSKAATYKLDATLSQVSLARLLEGTVEPEKELTGEVAGKLRLTWGQDFEKSLGGGGELRATKGSFAELPLFVGLLNVLRLRWPARALTTADMRFGLSKSKILVEEMILQGEGLPVYATGTIGLDKQLDLTFVIAKGGTRGLLKLVPLLGKLLDDILDELQQNLVAARVTGTVAEPKVSAVPLSSLRTQVTNFLQLLKRGEAGKEEKEEE